MAKTGNKNGPLVVSSDTFTMEQVKFFPDDELIYTVRTPHAGIIKKLSEIASRGDKAIKAYNKAKDDYDKQNEGTEGTPPFHDEELEGAVLTTSTELESFSLKVIKLLFSKEDVEEIEGRLEDWEDPLTSDVIIAMVGKLVGMGKENPTM